MQFLRTRSLHNFRALGRLVSRISGRNAVPRVAQMPGDNATREQDQSESFHVCQTIELLELTPN